MLAALYNKYGSVDEVELRQVPEPAVSAGEVLIRIKASSLNPVDYKIRRGDLRFLMRSNFPRITGADFAGEIEKIGSGVQDYLPGDRVFGMVPPFRGGACAEKIAIAATAIQKIPENLLFEEAAALPLAGGTAMQSLYDLGRLKSEMPVLINGASGGVGHLAVQIAKAGGAVVTAVCGKNNIQFCKELGADRVIDYSQTPVLETTGQYQLIFDVMSNLPPLKVRPLLAKKSVYVATLPTPGKLLLNGISKILPGRNWRVIMLKMTPRLLSGLCELAKSGKLKPTIGHQFPLAEIGTALRQIETGHTRGKIVLVH